MVMQGKPSYFLVGAISPVTSESLLWSQSCFLEARGAAAVYDGAPGDEADDENGPSTGSLSRYTKRLSHPNS